LSVRKRRIYKLIELSGGLLAAISSIDAKRVQQHLWQPCSYKGKVVSIRSATSQKIRLSLSRFIMKLRTRDHRVVDHWNGNIFDNRRCNLRVCTRQNNLQNSKPHSSTQFRGVSRIPYGKFRAQINKKHIGVFSKKEEAAKAYDAAARIQYGQFAFLNFPTKYEKPPKPPVKITRQEIKTHGMFTYRRSKTRKSIYTGVAPEYHAHGRISYKWYVTYKGVRYQFGKYLTEELAAQARETFLEKNNLPNLRNFQKKGRT
jgi:hypothetical protein